MQYVAKIFDGARSGMQVCWLNSFFVFFVGMAVVGLLLGAATRPAGSGAIAVGEAAPDFELSRLTIEEGADGKAVGKVGDEKVRLSSFKGKRPVVLIFSSYT
ncbi:MAG: hypothetical protein FWD53_09170 [Phycisphaerales bacterium]|nr:hypothetical protein [Phycisphaerales bacterium]